MSDRQARRELLDPRLESYLAFLALGALLLVVSYSDVEIVVMGYVWLTLSTGGEASDCD
jgi:hypothetical protein